MNNSHRNVITVLRHGRLQNTEHYYIDMELCQYSLRQYYKDLMWNFNELADSNPDQPVERAPRIKAAWKIMKQIAEGVTFIHSKGFTHRDLKPVNGEACSIVTLFASPIFYLHSLALRLMAVLFCATDNNWKVADFGTTREVGDSGTNTGAGHGTTGYRAPEIVVPIANFQEAHYSNSVDIFAMGCILFEICYRRRAFVDDIAIRSYHVVGTFPGFSTSLPGVERTRCIPEEGQLRSVITSMLSLDPESRPTALSLCGTFTYVESIPGISTPLPNRSIES